MQNKKDWQLPAGQLLFCVNCKEIVYFLLAKPSSSGKIILYALYYLPKERCKVQRKKKTENGILRLIFVAVALLIQVAWILVRVRLLNDYSDRIATITAILAMTVVLKLNSKHTNSAMKMPWVMVIMALPVMGLSMYLLFELLGDPGVGKRLRAVRNHLERKDETMVEENLEDLFRQDPAAANQFRYLWKAADYPVYTNTRVSYYGEAKDAFAAMKEELNKAERFIFMEYFIVENGESFRELEEILIRKAREGVEVRLLYDDFGSVAKIGRSFARDLRQKGIRCQPFNPASPVLNLFMNHRDHRKITVIDGKVGFTGGFNLSDEYFDLIRPYGKWKDTGIRLEGQAVRSLTSIFLELWYVQTKEKEPADAYLDDSYRVLSQGFVQPFADNPLETERIAENVYMNLINQANRSLYLMTPYLIITDEMIHALGLAAKRGVDVRVITPGIPDKKTVYAVTRSYYAGLARQGVRIFEYSPGFCHAKQCICDGKVACIGTSNLDYRSLYHHFENNVLLYGCEAVGKIEEDFEHLFPQCREVTENYASGRGGMLRTWQYILRLVAPLM